MASPWFPLHFSLENRHCPFHAKKKVTESIPDVLPPLKTPTRSLQVQTLARSTVLDQPLGVRYAREKQYGSRAE